jgi:gliding motility-associated lipoprotein GldH
LKKNQTMKKIIFILLTLLIISCSKNEVFEKFEKLDNYNWNMDKTIKFDVDIEDTSAEYNVYIPVRHIDAYPYDGLLINLTYTAPDGEERTRDIKLKFRDTDGKFLGDGSGDIWDEKSVVMTKKKFKAVGTYKFEIVNSMPTTPTQGIMEIGLRIEKVK